MSVCQKSRQDFFAICQTFMWKEYRDSWKFARYACFACTTTTYQNTTVKLETQFATFVLCERTDLIRWYRPHYGTAISHWVVVLPSLISLFLLPHFHWIASKQPARSLAVEMHERKSWGCQDWLSNSALLFICFRKSWLLGWRKVNSTWWKSRRCNGTWKVKWNYMY